MSNINLIGINTDKRIKEYFLSRNVPNFNLNLPFREAMSRDNLKKRTGIHKLPFNKNAFNLFVGGYGKWHHLSLGIIDTFYSDQDFDIINIDNHSDNRLSKDPDHVWCGNHIWHFQDDGKHILHIHKANDDLRVIYSLYTDYMRYRQDESIFVPNPTDISLDEALNSLKPKVYLTTDCDALGKKDYHLDNRQFWNPFTMRFDQGDMSLEDMLRIMGVIFEKKQVIGADLWGYGKGNEKVYDSAIEKMQNSATCMKNR